MTFTGLDIAALIPFAHSAYLAEAAYSCSSQNLKTVEALKREHAGWPVSGSLAMTYCIRAN